MPALASSSSKFGWSSRFVSIIRNDTLLHPDISVLHHPLWFKACAHLRRRVPQRHPYLQSAPCRPRFSCKGRRQPPPHTRAIDVVIPQPSRQSKGLVAGLWSAPQTPRTSTSAPTYNLVQRRPSVACRRQLGRPQILQLSTSSLPGCHDRDGYGQ